MIGLPMVSVRCDGVVTVNVERGERDRCGAGGARGLSAGEFMAIWLLKNPGWRAFEGRVFCPACVSGAGRAECGAAGAAGLRDAPALCPGGGDAGGGGDAMPGGSKDEFRSGVLPTGSPAHLAGSLPGGLVQSPNESGAGAETILEGGA